MAGKAVTALTRFTSSECPHKPSLYVILLLLLLDVLLPPVGDGKVSPSMQVMANPADCRKTEICWHDCVAAVLKQS